MNPTASPDVAIEELLKAFQTTPHGLTKTEAAARMARVGPNELPETRGFSPVVRLVAQFADLMIVILLLAIIIALTLGEIRDALVLVAIVLINVIIGFTQEYKAERSLKALRSLVPHRTKVWRNNELIELARWELVPGDVVELSAGDIVPADGRLMSANDIRVDESLLTGESMPVMKALEHQGGEDDVWMSTLVRNGTGQMIVTNTGGRTRFGQLAVSVATTGKDTSPLTDALNRLSRRVALLAAIVLVLMVGYGIATGEELNDQFFFALALAASVVPEGLPATLSVVLALAATRLAKKKALVKRLTAVETLGAVTVICTDKTGTLTENRMTVDRVWLAPGKKSSQLAQIAALANNAHLDEEPANDIGDPMEVALARWASRDHDHFLNLHTKTPRLHEFPFIEEERLMSVIITHGTKATLLVKGAPDRIVNLAKLSPVTKKAIDHQLVTWADQGYRVLALAERPLTSLQTKSLDRHRLEHDLSFVGLVALVDPPRADAASAVAAARGAGIRVIMLTGDDPHTAASIARRVGILRPGESTIVTGTDIAAMEESDLRTILLGPAVIARIDPLQKLRVIETLKQMGDVVAVTGDGVNDGPALKRADIGIAMGKGGTDVAREAADVILLDDHFGTIVIAIEQGRLLFINLKKTIWYMLSANTDELFTILFGALLQLPLLPIRAVQILAINLGTDVLPSFGLAVDSPDRKLLTEPPRSKMEDFITWRDIRRLLVVGSIVGFAAIVNFLQVMGRGVSETLTADQLYGRATFAAYAAIVLCQIVNNLSSRSQTRSIFQMEWRSNRFLIFAEVFTVAMLLVIVYFPPIQQALGGGPLHGFDWLVAGLFAILFLIIEETRKWWSWSRAKHV